MLSIIILEQLKSSGLKVTLPRRIVLEVLSESESPLNPYEIVDAAKGKGKKLDVVTVYRIMDAFEQNSIVHKLKGQNKYMICEHPCSEHCHHQFICDSCGDVSDLHVSDSDFLSEISKKFADLKIKAHYFEFSGLCKKCN